MLNSGTVVTEYALLTAICWGFADFVWAKAAKSIGPVLSLALASILEAPLMIIYYLLSHHHWIYNEKAFVFAALAGLAFTLGGTLFLIGLEKGPVSIVSPISSTYPLITGLISIFIFNSRLTKMDLIGIFIVLTGIFLVSGIVDARKTEFKLSYGVKAALVTACLWGLAFSLLGQTISRVGWLNATLLEVCFSTLWVPFLLFLMKNKEKITGKIIFRNLSNKYALLATIINLVGFISLSFAISKSTSSGGAVAAAISSCYPALTIVLALRHFKEKVKPIVLAGSLLGIGGVVLLSLP